MRFLPLVLPMLLAPVLMAQAPVDDIAPANPAQGGQPDGVVDCTTIGKFFDVTATCGTGDVRILGCANIDSNLTGVRKWFFSGSNGGTTPQTNQQIYIYDSDEANYPIASTARGVLHSPTMVSSLWGHRDGEGYTYLDTTTSALRSIVMFGDEADNLDWMNAATEAWVGTANLTGWSGAVIRALAVRRDDSVPGFNTETVKVYVSDFSSGIAVWNLNLATGVVAQDLSNPPLSSPLNTYGASCFFYNNNWYLAVHHQAANTCSAAGVGLVKISVIDITSGANYGTVVWTRTMDTSILGATPNLAGGIAGGLQYAIVNGQPCFAGLQQATADSCGFVGLSAVQGLPGPADCGVETLIMESDGTNLGLRIVNRDPTEIYLVGVNFPPAAGVPLPFNPACTLDLGLPIPVVYLLIGTGSTPSTTFPLGTTLDLVADGGALGILTNVITSTNRVDIKLCPAPF